MTKANRRLFLLLGATVLMLAACAGQPDPTWRSGAPGFFSGLWHGLVAPFALIAHIFAHEIRIYAFPNNGGWYDFGFIIGIMAWGGGAASSR